MKLIVGLGNPGKEYSHTRHNIGFDAIDAIAGVWEYANTATLKAERKDKLYEGKEYEVEVNGQKEVVLLVKPLTFMNRSGEAVKALIKKYETKLTPKDDLIVIQDELDVVLGRVKIDHGSSSAGHNGIQNIIDQLGTKEFTRLRIGIMPTEGTRDSVEDFVLRRFTNPEQGEIDEVLKQITAIIDGILTKGLEAARTQFNRKSAKE